MKWVCGSLNDFSENEYSDTYNNLSLSRKLRIDRKMNELDRKRSLLAEMLLKCLLKEEGIEDTVIEVRENGKPYLKNSPLYISISHSGDMAACAISEKFVGIDIEKMREVNPRLINRICTDEEKTFIEHSKDKNEALLDIWTAKEAYFKITGTENYKEINTLTLHKQLYKKEKYVIQIVLV